MFALLLLFCFGFHDGFAATRPDFKNVIVIGWDGTQRDRMEKLLHEGKLPNLKALIAQGSYVKTEVTQGATKTKPGWSQILTGYDTTVLGVTTNRFYDPIPEGYTVFERLKEKFGDQGITTVFVAGKGNEVGARGPHRICINCLARFPKDYTQTGWWDETAPPEKAPTHDGSPRQMVDRKGEPFYNALKKIDLYRNGLNEEDKVLPVVLKTLEDLKTKKFFAFFHFEEPDEPEHQHGLASPQYTEALIKVDSALGAIVRQLKGEGIYRQTVIIVTTDHGQTLKVRKHDHAPDTFVASTLRGLSRTGDRRDVAPTILDLYGFDLATIKPELTGDSLLRGKKKREAPKSSPSNTDESEDD